SFLNSGNTVNHYLAAKLAGEVKPKVGHWTASLVLSCLLLAIAQWQFAVMTSAAATMLVLFALAALILPSLTRFDRAFVPRVIITLLFAAGLLTLYTTAKHHLAVLVGLDTPLNIYADIFVALLFASLFSLSIALQYWPHIRWVKRLFIWLNAGAYLDEWATRLTLKWWPSESLIKLQHEQWQEKPEAK
ncbi:hypothetical protein OAP63_13400, partial [Vibrio sp.]|nr:hypothetical protein [Vibrio sp.]